MIGVGRKMRERLRSWWNGKYVVHENEPGSSLVFIGGVTHWHWTARVARAVVGFLGREWKWVIGTLIALVGLTMTYIRFF